MTRWRTGVGALVLLLGVAGCDAGSLFGLGGPVWPEGSVHGPWRVVYNGYGSVLGIDGDIVLEPKAAVSPDLTHAALVAHEAELGDLEVSAVIRNEEQLRVGEPNAWEVGWLLWRYTDDNRFYAVALKPNGWEVTKQDAAYPGAQRFLDTGTEPTFPLGEDHEVTVVHRGNTLTVTANGEELTTFTDTERPYGRGAVALYTEDARVAFSDIRISPAAGQ